MPSVTQPVAWVTDPVALTPVTSCGDMWLKRDDLFHYAGCRGGKVRICLALARAAKGLVAASHRHSPQMSMVSRIARELGLPCRIHTATGTETQQMSLAIGNGASIVQHTPGYNGVIIARARQDAASLGWKEIPFGMESEDGIRCTAPQTANIPAAARRIVIAVGIGMALSGVLHGLLQRHRRLPVLAVAVGLPKPEKYISRLAPPEWEDQVSLVRAPENYSDHVTASVGGVPLDPVYEAKAARFLRSGDCFWVVGNREMATGCSGP